MPDLSVISLTMNSEAYIERFLHTLTDDINACNIDTEIIIAENGSCDRTVDIIESYRRQYPFITLIKLDRNFGTTKPRNLGIRRAVGKYVLIIDSDTEIPLGTLEKLVDSFDKIPVDIKDIAIVHPRLVYPDLTFQESARRFPTIFTKIFRFLNLSAARSRDESIQAVLQEKITPVDYAASAAWLIPRVIFDVVGLLDERIFYSPEDLEFCIRCWQKGFTVWYYPHATIIHHSQRMTVKHPLSSQGIDHIRNLIKLWLKYGFMFTRRKLIMNSRIGTLS